MKKVAVKVDLEAFNIQQLWFQTQFETGVQFLLFM